MTVQTVTEPSRNDARPRAVERLAALSGAVFVVLLLVHASLLAGGVPSIGASGQKIITYLADHKSELQIGTYLQGLAMVAALWFLGSLWHQLRDAERGSGRLSVVVVAGATSLVAMIGIHIATLMALALRSGSGLDPRLASTLWTFAFVVLGLTAFPTAALMAAVGALAARTGAFPRWFAGFSFGGAALWLLSGIGAATDNDIWGNVGMVAFLGWLAWTATASVLIARPTRPAVLADQ